MEEKTELYRNIPSVESIKKTIYDKYFTEKRYGHKLQELMLMKEFFTGVAEVVHGIINDITKPSSFKKRPSVEIQRTYLYESGNIKANRYKCVCGFNGIALAYSYCPMCGSTLKFSSNVIQPEHKNKKLISV